MKNPAPEGASLASAQGSTGVDQDRGMCEEKRNDDHPAEGGTLNSGRRMAPSVGEFKVPIQSARQNVETLLAIIQSARLIQSARQNVETLLAMGDWLGRVGE